MNSSNDACTFTRPGFRRGSLFPALLLIAFGTACAQSDQATLADPPPGSGDSEATTQYKPRSERPATLPSGLERVPVEAPAVPVSGEVPGDLMEAIMADLMALKNIRRDEIEVIRAEAVIWPDGSLGCAQGREMYTHAPVEGYWVVLGWAEKTFDYRATTKGIFRLCTNAIGEHNPVG